MHKIYERITSFIYFMLIFERITSFIYLMHINFDNNNNNNAVTGGR